MVQDRAVAQSCHLDQFRCEAGGFVETSSQLRSQAEDSLRFATEQQKAAGRMKADVASAERLGESGMVACGCGGRQGLEKVLEGVPGYLVSHGGELEPGMAVGGPATSAFPSIVSVDGCRPRLWQHVLGSHSPWSRLWPGLRTWPQIVAQQVLRNPGAYTRWCASVDIGRGDYGDVGRALGVPRAPNSSSVGEAPVVADGRGRAVAAPPDRCARTPRRATCSRVHALRAPSRAKGRAAVAVPEMSPDVAYM